MAESFDRRRFGGPIGKLLREDQERVLLAFLGEINGASIVDVGAGTGRAALALARRGARVTAVDASGEMLAMARRRAADERLSVVFSEGDAHALSYPDRRFDAAVSLRVLMHTPDWRACLRELCRISRHRVVFDYPALWSVAMLQAAGRRITATLGRQVEAYRVLSGRSISHELRTSGFRILAIHRQFVLPIALHKAIGSVAVTRSVEGALARLGLLRLLGSPVTIVAERCESS
jgi:SAM-dependent methyltransferase